MHAMLYCGTLLPDRHGNLLPVGNLRLPNHRPTTNIHMRTLHMMYGKIHTYVWQNLYDSCFYESYTNNCEIKKERACLL